MDKQYFIKKCKELVIAIDCETPGNLTLNEYYKKFQNIHENRFDDMIEVLKDSTKYKRFPLIWDFKQAESGTVKPQNKYYPPDEPIDREEYSKDILALAKKYRAKPKDGERKTQKQMYEEKFKENKVWSYDKHKWVDRSLMGNIGGDFLLPEEKLKAFKSDLSSISSILDDL